MDRASSKPARRWRKVGGVSHLFGRRRGKWASLCGFFALAETRGHRPGRPGERTCSLCRVAGERRRSIRVRDLVGTRGAG